MPAAAHLGGGRDDSGDSAPASHVGDLEFPASRSGPEPALAMAGVRIVSQFSGLELFLSVCLSLPLK